MENNINSSGTFTAWAFHLNPFGGRGFWRGFIEKNTIEVTPEEITVGSGSYQSTFPIKKLEILYTERNRWFGFGLKRYVLGQEDAGSLDLDYFYLGKDFFEQLSNDLRRKGATFDDKNHLLVKSPTNKKKLWGNADSVYTIKYGCIKKFKWEQKAISDLKYAFSRGVIYKNTFLGDNNSSLKMANLHAGSKHRIFDFVKQHGGNLDEDDTAVSYSDCFTPAVIFNPKKWFYHSSIGFKANGVVFRQKTFKTEDSLFLPYDKVNLVLCKSSFLSPLAKIQIFGEQNILPKRKYSKSSAHAIEKKLLAHGVKSFSGESFGPSYHTSWFGILLSIITLSIYHWIVVLITP